MSIRRPILATVATCLPDSELEGFQAYLNELKFEDTQAFTIKNSFALHVLLNSPGDVVRFRVLRPDVEYYNKYQLDEAEIVEDLFSDVDLTEYFGLYDK